MPKTIIIRQAWYCNTCRMDSGTNNAGGWETGVETPVPCPRKGCHGVVTRETDPARCGILTVMGVEDIEDEIAQTTVTQRFQRREHERAKRGRTPLTPAELAATGTAEVTAYRTDRLLDITHAIGEAIKREHKP